MIESTVETVLAQTWLKGRLQYNYLSEDKVVAEVVAYHENKQIRFQYPIHNNKIHGVCRIWYSNGVLQSEGSYIHNVLDGLQKEWHLNGKLKKEVNYKRGLIDGLSREWDETGIQQVKRSYIRNVEIPPNIYRHIKSKRLTAKVILGIRNSAVRRICLEELGYAQFLNQVDYQLIENNGECELIRIDWHKREEHICLVKVKCPSTGAFYTLRVPPGMQTVKEAVAWTFGLKPDEYCPDNET